MSYFFAPDSSDIHFYPITAEATAFVEVVFSDPKALVRFTFVDLFLFEKVPH